MTIRPAAAATAPAAHTGPALADTLDFISSRLGQQGKINYAGFLHDAADNSDWVNQFNVEASNVKSDPAGCSVDFHWTTAVDNKVAQDWDTRFNFATLETVALTSMEQDMNKITARDGHPTWTARVNPSIWVVTASNAEGKTYVVDFREQALAQRVIKAMDRAILLCHHGKRAAF